jgi:hypothetical protein
MSNEIIILAKAVGAGNTADFKPSPNAPVTISVYPEANLGTDVGYLVKKNPDGTYDSTYHDNGAVISISALRPHIIVSASGTFRVEFAARTAAIGVTKLQYNRF